MPVWDQLPALDREDYKPAYLQLSHILAEYITAQKLAPGDLLPSEAELIERFGLSRTTVRQAIQRLENQRLVKKVRGKGTFVTEVRRRSLLSGGYSFEDGLAERGLVVTNRVLEQTEATPPSWAEGVCAPGQAGWLLRRLKLVQGRPFALESRFLPLTARAVIDQAGLVTLPFRDLLDHDPRFRMTRILYRITSRHASPGESASLDLAGGAAVTVRYSQYLNQEDQLFMAGQMVISPEAAELKYDFFRRSTAG